MIYITLHGGLGNQMFEYAAARNVALKTKDKLTLDLRSLSNKSHEVYTLDKLNIDKNTLLHKEGKIVLSITQRIIWKIVNLRVVGYISRRGPAIRHKIELFLRPILNLVGIHLCTDGYIKMKFGKTKHKYLDGYFQSSKFFDENKNTIQEELRVKSKPSVENQKLITELSSCNSVCLHIRRGDYTKLTNHLVCDIDYYLKAMDLMHEKIKDSVFYIFSDDISWVKENVKFKYKVHYMETNNPNYEELRLMYSCNNFIISNSSFSWWAQYLCNNDKKIVISPNIWYRNKKQATDLINEDFLKIIVDEKRAS